MEELLKNAKEFTREILNDIQKEIKTTFPESAWDKKFKAAENFTDELFSFMEKNIIETSGVIENEWEVKYKLAEDAVRYWNAPEYPDEPVTTLDDMIAHYKNRYNGR